MVPVNMVKKRVQQKLVGGAAIRSQSTFLWFLPKNLVTNVDGEVVRLSAIKSTVKMKSLCRVLVRCSSTSPFGMIRVILTNSITEVWLPKRIA